MKEDIKTKLSKKIGGGLLFGMLIGAAIVLGLFDLISGHIVAAVLQFLIALLLYVVNAQHVIIKELFVLVKDVLKESEDMLKDLEGLVPDNIKHHAKREEPNTNPSKPQE